jgi:hypothetical protein
MNGRAYLITFLFGVLIVQHTWSQYDYEPAEYPMPNERNTFGVNLTPAAVVLFNGYPIIPRFGLYYKRQTKPNRTFRILANFENIEQYAAKRDAFPVQFTDTTVTYEVRDRHYFNVDLRIGVEFFKPGERFSMIYGVDVFGGLAVRNDLNINSPWYFNPENESWVPSPFVVSTRASQEVIYGIAGFDFSIAQRLGINDHVYLTLQWMPEVVLQWPIAERYSAPSARIDAPPTTVNFRLRGIELYFHYSF